MMARLESKLSQSGWWSENIIGAIKVKKTVLDGLS